MARSPTAPRTIRRIAARRVFRSAHGKLVVLTIGVPQPVRGSDWGCPLHITGLETPWRRPRYVFGVDALQALCLAIQCAGVELEMATVKLVWLSEKGDLGMPKFLPALPKPYRDRLEALVEREVIKTWREVERAAKLRSAKRTQGGTVRRPSR